MVGNIEGNTEPNRRAIPIGLSDSLAVANRFSSAILFLGTPHPALPHKGGGKVIRIMEVFFDPQKDERTKRPGINACFSSTARFQNLFLPPCGGGQGGGVSPAGRGYHRPSLGAAGPIIERPGWINPTLPVSPVNFGQLIGQFWSIECAHYLRNSGYGSAPS
jgi:hypothetical protein